MYAKKLLILIAIITLAIPFAHAGLISTITGSLSTMYKAYSWLKKNGNPLNKSLVNKVKSTWNGQELTWFTLEGSEMKVHFVYPKYENSGDWRNQQLVIAADIAKGGNGGASLQNLLDNLEDIAQEYGWYYKMSKQPGPVFRYFHNDGKVQWYEKCCSNEYWVAVGPFESWADIYGLPDDKLEERARMYTQKCDETYGAKLGPLC